MAYLLVGTLALSSPLAASASVSDFLRAYGIKMERSEKEADENGLWTNTNTGFWTDGWTGDKTDTVQTIKKKLQELITYCKDTSKYNEKDYTKGSWRAFQSAITEAESVVNAVSNDSVSKDDVQEMQEAGDKLTDARKNLVSIKMLNEKIAEAEALFEKSDSYVETTWEALKTALEKAREIVRKENATQKEVDSALEELESAISDLDSKEVNKTDLQALIVVCDAITNKDGKEWTKATWETFQYQLSLAKRVNSNPNATQQEVDDAIDALQEAKLALEKSGSETVDKADLKALIDECKKLTNEGYKNYTKATWDVFAAALEKAEDVYADDKATSSEVETAYNNLRDARLALEKSGSEAVDKAALKELIDKCKKLTNEGYKNYTKASWDVFTAALKKAETVYDNDKATSTEVENAYIGLKNAYSTLEETGFKTGTVPIDPDITEHEASIFGITLDKDTLSLDYNAKDGLKARVLFDNYNADKENMDWAIDSGVRSKIEGSIKWYTADNSVAMVTGKGTDATVTGAGDGKTEVMAWIEADGKTVSGKTNTVPTEGDYIAKAVVTVKEHAKSLRFDVDAVKYVAGNEYELRDYTYLVLDSGKERPATESQVGITYSFAEKLPRGVKATITGSG